LTAYTTTGGDGEQQKRFQAGKFSAKSGSGSGSKRGYFGWQRGRLHLQARKNQSGDTKTERNYNCEGD
jgi:hypothetical protein